VTNGRISGDVLLDGGAGAQLTYNTLGSLTLDSGATSPVIEHNLIQSESLALGLENGGAVGVTITDNDIQAEVDGTGAVGISILGPSSGLITGNRILSSGVGLDIKAPFDGPIESNLI